MTLLIDLKAPDWISDAEMRDDLLGYYPEADIRIASDPGDPAAVEMLTVTNYRPGEALDYPNLKLIQKTGAGVNNILVDDRLPGSIAVARLRTETSGAEMAEYALAYVLQEQRHMRLYHEQQSRSQWIAYAPRKAASTAVTVLGLGRIGQVVARRFVDNGFRVRGWSRGLKDLPGIDCHAGESGFREAVAGADYVVSVLPSTALTRGMFARDLFALFDASAIFVNVGRGDLVNEAELVEALDEGLLAGAVLDVMSREPLPPESPLWLHPRIQLTPHISGYHLGDAIEDIAENYRRLQRGDALLNLVDRELGY